MPANPTILKNCVRPQTQLLIGAVLVVLITKHSKHQSNQVWFVYVCHRSGHLIVGRRLQMLWTDIYVNRVCFVRRFMRSESSKYNERSSSGD